MFLSIIYKLFMHYFCIVGGPSMTQGNTPSLQRENHTHTHYNYIVYDNTN